MADVCAVTDEWGKLGDCTVVESCDNEARRPAAHPTVVSSKPGPVAESAIQFCFISLTLLMLPFQEFINKLLCI